MGLVDWTQPIELENGEKAELYEDRPPAKGQKTISVRIWGGHRKGTKDSNWDIWQYNVETGEWSTRGDSSPCWRVVNSGPSVIEDWRL